MVFAMGLDRELGYKNGLPWKRMDNDMRRFHEMVKDRVVIMGWNSYSHLPIELAWRYMIVISSSSDSDPKFARSVFVLSKADALRVAAERSKDDEEIMIAGGGRTYAEFLPVADTLYVTYIKDHFVADTYFPEFNQEEWVEVEREDYGADEKNPYPYSFVTLARKR